MRLSSRRGVGFVVVGVGAALVAACTPQSAIGRPSRPHRPTTTQISAVHAPAATVPATTAPRPTAPTSTSTSTIPRSTVPSTTVPAPPNANPAGAPAGTYASPSGNDAAGSGSITHPYATVAKAIASTPSGGTVVLRGGVYREGDIDIARPVTILGFPGEQPWLDGSTIPTGWVAANGTWRLDHSPSAGLCRYGIDPCVQDSSQIDSQYPMAGSPQGVLRNGVMLEEVTPTATVRPGTFSFDPLSGELSIGDDPAAATIEVVSSPKALDISASKVTLRGFGVRNYGSILNPGNVGGYHLAAVQAAGGDGLVVENVTFFQNASRGLFISASTNARVSGSVFLDNGLNGIDVFASSGVVVERNRVVGNNAEHFSTAAGAYSVAAGSKVVRSTDVTVRDNLFDSNAATGWWCDEGCSGVTVVRNQFSRNTNHGIFYEVSGGAIIASNLVLGNGNNGIYVLGPDNQVWNNTVIGNRQALAFYEDPRNRGPLDNTRNNVAHNNVLANATTGAPNNLGETPKLIDIQGFNYPESVDPAAMVTELDDNAYDQGPGSSAPIVGWGARGIATSFGDLASLQAATGREIHGLSGNGRTALVPNAGGALLPPDALTLIIGAGTALPAPIAEAIGTAPGTTVGIGADRSTTTG